MTGRDLIVYILENGLEDKPVFKDGQFIGFNTVEETALKYNVGTSTILSWYKIGMLFGFEVGDTIYIPANAELKFG